MYALHATITHILSQLCHHWIPLPALHEVEGDIASLHPLHMRPEAWRELCAFGCESNRSWPWAHVLRERLQGNVETLCHTLQRHLDAVRAHNADYVTFADPAYPALLREISDPPAALSLWGHRETWQQAAYAIVGARKASRDSLLLAGELANTLALREAVVVSGGAYGCDIAAHQGAWRSGRRPAPTIVVFAGGLGCLYPKTLVPFFKNLQRDGAMLVSEKLWWHQPRPYDFLSRNRLIAGMCRELVLIQAAERSGAATTVQHALQQGREVTVWRGPCQDDVRFAGNQLFIADGAPSFVAAKDYCYRHPPVSEDEEDERAPVPFAWPFAEG